MEDRRENTFIYANGYAYANSEHEICVAFRTDVPIFSMVENGVKTDTDTIASIRVVMPRAIALELAKNILEDNKSEKDV